MFQQIDQLGVVKGCSIYKMIDGVVEGKPVAIDAEVSLPQITHPTYTMQCMGDMELADQTRVNPMTLGINCEPSIIQSKLMGKGVQSYVIRWAQEVKRANGIFELIPYIVYVSGIPREDVSATVRPGEGTTGTLNIDVVKYRLVENGQELRYIDRVAGILKINGEDFRAEIDAML
jgi:phage tail tube protein FII